MLTTGEEFCSWQKQTRRHLAGWLMNGGLPGRVPVDEEVLATEEFPGFILQRVRYRSQADRTNTLLISLPKNAERVPLLLALHGHEATWGEADAGAFRAGHADDFCAYFAERGWAVVQPATMNHTLQHPGWTLQGEWTWDAMVALDYALALPGIDPNRVAVCGLSTGGHLAMNLLALDDRVQAGVVGCILSTWRHYRERMIIPPHCDCGILGQLGDRLQQSEWAALAAPKPVQYQHGKRDSAFCPNADPQFLKPEWNRAVMPAAEFAEAWEEIERAYQLTGGVLSLHIHEGDHAVDNAPAFEFLSQQLEIK